MTVGELLDRLSTLPRSEEIGISGHGGDNLRLLGVWVAAEHGEFAHSEDDRDYEIVLLVD